MIHLTLRNVLKLLTSVILGLILMGAGCKKVPKGKKMNSPKGKNSRQGISRSASAAIKRTLIVSGVFFVGQQALAAAFEEGEEKEPISVELMNQRVTPIDLNITLDGENWERRVVPGMEKLEIESENKGLIGIEKNDKFYQVEESNTLIIKEDENSDLNFYAN